MDHFIIHDYDDHNHADDKMIHDFKWSMILIHDFDPWLIMDVKKLYDVYIVQFLDIND